MSEQSPRVLLERADRERAVAHGVEMIGVTFRLGNKLAVKRGLFGRRVTGTEEFRALTSDESMALYRAAQIVRREALAEAERLEAMVTTANPPHPESEAAAVVGMLEEGR